MLKVSEQTIGARGLDDKKKITWKVIFFDQTKWHNSHSSLLQGWSWQAMEYTRKRFSIPSTKSWYRRFSNSFSHITGQNTTFGRNRILPKVAALVGVGISSHWAFWALCLSVVRYFRGAKVLIEVGALISFAYLCTYWVSCVYQKKIEKLSAEIK